MVVCYVCIHCIIFEEMEWWEIILLVFIGVLSIYSAIITFTHTSSISLDYEGFTVTTRSRLTSKLMMDSYKWKEIDDLSNFKGRDYGGRSVPENGIESRVLKLAIPEGATQSQLDQLMRLIDYAQQNNVQLYIVLAK